jgi:hypothetical protein
MRVVGQFQFGINEGPATLGEAPKFGAPRTPLRKNGAWRPVLDRPPPNYV